MKKETKDKLISAFIALTKRKALDAISISELTTLAKINRGTFYLAYEDFNDFIFQNYPRTGEAAKRVCDYMSRQLKQPVAKEEIGFLAIHIQRVISPDTV